MSVPQRGTLFEEDEGVGVTDAKPEGKTTSEARNGALAG